MHSLYVQMLALLSPSFPGFKVVIQSNMKGLLKQKIQQSVAENWVLVSCVIWHRAASLPFWAHPDPATNKFLCVLYRNSLHFPWRWYLLVPGHILLLTTFLFFFPWVRLDSRRYLNIGGIKKNSNWFWKC